LFTIFELFIREVAMSQALIVNDVREKLMNVDDGIRTDCLFETLSERQVPHPSMPGDLNVG
jgi:hypothetical protein